MKSTAIEWRREKEPAEPHITFDEINAGHPFRLVSMRGPNKPTHVLVRMRTPSPTYLTFHGERDDDRNHKFAFNMTKGTLANLDGKTPVIPLSMTIDYVEAL